MIKHIILLPAIAFFYFTNLQACYSQTTANGDKEHSNIDFIEKRYPYGRVGFNDFIKKNLEYPTKARADSIEGTVFINFIVNSSGYISDVKIEKGIRNDLDNECIRVIQLMKWKPQSSNEELLNVNITLPITFDLSNESEGNTLNYILSPNPADQGFILRIFSSEYEFQYELQDKNGKVRREGTIITGKTVHVNTIDLQEGKYFFRLFSDAIDIEKIDTLIIKR